MRVRGSVADALAGAAFDVERCDDAPQRLDAGTHRVTTDTEPRTGLQVDRVVLAPDVVEPAATAPADGPTERHGDVERPLAPHGAASTGAPTAAGWCSARATTSRGRRGPTTGRSVRRSSSTAASTVGGSRPASTPTTVHIAWTAQRPLDVALAVSLAAVVMAVVIAVADRRRLPPVPADRAGVLAARRPVRRTACAARSPARAWVGGAALFVTPGYAVWGLLGGARARGNAAASAWPASWRSSRSCYIAYEVVDTVRAEHPDATPLFPGALRAAPPPRPVRRRQPRRHVGGAGSASTGAMNTAIG